MTAKEYLGQAYRLDQRINSKLRYLESLKSLAMQVTANFTQVKVSGGRNIRGSFENTMAKIIDLEKEINQEIDHFIELKQEILNVICKLEDINYQLVLEQRYLDNKSWEDISLGLGYSRSGVFRIHSEALKEVTKVLKCGLK